MLPTTMQKARKLQGLTSVTPHFIIGQLMPQKKLSNPRRMNPVRGAVDSARGSAPGALTRHA
jgi:hypothetical protein